LLLDRRLAEQVADIENAQAAHFQKIADQRGAITFQRFRGNMLQFDRIVGDQPVSTRDKFQRQFAFADPGVALDEHPGAKHFEKHAMQCGELG
jgi:hypothetical protein